MAQLSLTPFVLRLAIPNFICPLERRRITGALILVGQQDIAPGGGGGGTTAPIPPGGRLSFPFTATLSRESWEVGKIRGNVIMYHLWLPPLAVSANAPS